MRNERLCYLRKARLTVHEHLARLEPQVEHYRAKLSEIEAEIQEHAPGIFLQPRRYQRNPIFARRELPRLALTILREAGEPMHVSAIADRVLAMKAIEDPEPWLRKKTRHQLRCMFAQLDKRGVTVRVGSGNGSRRGLPN